MLVSIYFIKHKTINSLSHYTHSAVLLNYQEGDMDTEKCSLHLLLRENLFKYCVISPNNSIKVIQVFHLEDNLEDLFEQEKWLKAPYAKVRAAIFDSSRALIPSDFFDFNELKTFYGSPQKKEDKLLYDYIDTLNHYNIYKVENERFELIRSNYPQSLFQCGTSIWINSLIEENHYNVDTKMYISMGEKYMEVAILKGNEMSFSGSFLCKTPEDFLYYVLTSAKEQELDLAKDQFVLLDNFDEESILPLLQEYITSIQTGYPSDKHDLPEELRLEKMFHHYDLLSI